MPGPFAGIKVLELGRFIAVPYCGEMLAEAGAEVTKVEALDGDQTRHNGPIIEGEGRQFVNKNRGKRSLSVDLGDPEACAAVRALAVQSDVVLANFRPGVSERLGLDYDTVREANPGVIYAENTAFGRRGPMAGLTGMDVVLQGYSGLAHQTAHGPEQLVNPMIDYTSALSMAWGVASALFHRERTGEGQRLDVALLHSAMILQNNHMTHVDAIDGWREEFVDYLHQALADGVGWGEILEHRAGMQPHEATGVYGGIFRTADGMVTIACGTRALRQGMAGLMELDDRRLTEPGWLPEDPRAHTAHVRDQVIEKFRQRSSSHWLETFQAKGLPIAPARMMDEMFDDPQAIENGFLGEFEHELIGRVKVVATPVRFDRTPTTILASAPLGKHTREVLADAGLADDAIQRLVDRGAVRTFEPPSERTD